MTALHASIRCLIVWTCLGATALLGDEPTKRATVPDQAARTKSLEEVKSVLSDDFEKLPKADLARKLMSIGRSTKEDSTRRYVLFQEAAKAAIAAGDGPLICEAVDMLSQYYDGLDAMDLKVRGLERAAKPPESDGASPTESLANFLVKYSNRLIDEDNYDAALRLNKVSMTVATRLADNKDRSKEDKDKDKKAKLYHKQIKDLQKQVDSLRKDYVQTANALNQLANEPYNSRTSYQRSQQRSLLRARLRELEMRNMQATQQLVLLKQTSSPGPDPKLSENLLKQVREELVKQIRDQQGRIDSMKREYEKVAPAITQLLKKPLDPQANLTAGKYYALNKGNWEKGVPMLALGSDAELKAAALLDLAQPVPVQMQADLADKWWALSTTADESTAPQFQQRAAHWYAKAYPRVQDEFLRVKIQKRLESVTKVPLQKNEPAGGALVGEAPAAGVDRSDCTGFMKIFDDDAATYVDQWTTYTGGYKNNMKYRAGGGTGTKTATWTFSGLSPGHYEVYATWTPYSIGATNAGYVITGDAELPVVRVNQSHAPTPHDVVETVSFQKLGTVALKGSKLTVKLLDDANNYVFADAVLLTCKVFEPAMEDRNTDGVEVDRNPMVVPFGGRPGAMPQRPMQIPGTGQNVPFRNAPRPSDR